MDPIEVFELASYVVESFGPNPATAVFIKELNAYVVQAASAANTVFLTEPRVYVVQTGRANLGVTTNYHSAYLVVRDDLSVGVGENTTQGITLREDGVGVMAMVGYTVVGHHNAQGMNVKGVTGRDVAPHRKPGVKSYKTTVYTIQVP